MSGHAEDDLTCFQRAMGKKDWPHAAHHLAGLVAEGRTPTHEAAVELFASSVEDPLAHAQMGPTPYYGLVVLHAIFAARAGNVARALPLLLQVKALVPQADVLAWGEEWLADPRVVAGLDLEALARSISAAQPPAQELCGVVDRIRQAREPNGLLTMVLCRLVRTGGDLEGALRIGEEEHARAPSYFTSIARAVVYRNQERIEDAIAAYRDAADRKPDDVGARLDIGDLLLESGDRAGALEAYGAAMALEPQQSWAWASQLYILALEGDGASRQQLGMLAAGENERAMDLFGRLEPFVADLEPPGASCVNAVRNALSQGAKVSTMAVSSLEPPSAVLACRRLMLKAGQVPELDISFGELPKADPRSALRPVEWRLWKYDGTTAEPALEPPPEDIRDAIARLAATPYQAKMWATEARTLAERLGPGAAEHVLACMVYPPDAPGDPAMWIFRYQVAAAFVACRLGEGRGDKALGSLVFGAVDWTSTAGIIAATELAREVPSLSESLYSRFFALLDENEGRIETPIHHGCIGRPLVYCMLRLPDLSWKLRDELTERRDHFETDG